MLPNDELSAQKKSANLCRHLIEAAKTSPDLLAVAVQKSSKQLFSLQRKLTYQEISFSALDKQSDLIAYALNDYGIKSGMKAVLMVTPSIDFFALTFALFKAGIIPILVDPGMGVKNLKQCFSESAPDAFIGIPKAHIARALFSWGKASVKSLITVGKGSFLGGMNLNTLTSASGVIEQGRLPYPMIGLDDDEISAILFTSGSTGVPKGVVYSHKMFEAQIRALKNDYNIVPGERDLATFPLFSLFGPALGMASIVPDMDASKPITANPDNIFAAIEKYQCSNLFANPALIEVLGQAGEKKQAPFTLSSIKRVISAGAPATISSIACFSKMLKPGAEVLNSYGATESLPLTKLGSEALLTTTTITDNGGGICVGMPIEGVEIAIIAIDEGNIEQWNDELILPINTIGEIVVKGDMVSQAYYQRPEATLIAKISESKITETRTTEVSALVQSSATVYRHRMGDLGYFDSEGKLWMCGRKAHRVETPVQSYYSIPCERIYNTHEAVKRSALVAVTINSKVIPLICIELNKDLAKQDVNEARLFKELQVIGDSHQQCQGIQHFLIHPNFPVDIRHNAKIFREKLAVWAQQQLKSTH